jgi:hypothetical protein
LFRNLENLYLLSTFAGLFGMQKFPAADPVFTDFHKMRCSPKLASISRKPSVYAGENEPTAVYDAALSCVCQSKNRHLFRFRRVFPRIVPISRAFPRFMHITATECYVAGAAFKARSTLEDQSRSRA